MRTTLRKWALTGIIVIPGVLCQAAESVSEFHHNAWTGLGAVFDIKQSAEGYLWLTTSRGVRRFDGVRFQTVEEVTRGTVLDSEIDSVFLSSSGGIWLTTQGAGLLFWKDGKLTAYPDRRCTPTRKQGQIIEDRDGSLWVQATAGLFRLRGSRCEQIGAEQGYPGRFPAGILLDSDGTLWVKPIAGSLRFLPRGQQKFQTSPYGEGTSTGFAWLHEAPDGSIWLSDDQGLRRVAGKLSLAATPVTAPVSKQKKRFGDFAFASDGSLWSATDAGVTRFEHVDRWPAPAAAAKAPGETFAPQTGLSSDAVSKVLIDREGVWIGTNSGLDRLRRARLTTVLLPHASEHEFSVAAGEAGSVWTGNSNLPLTHVLADGAITTFPATRQTISVRRDHTGTIWSAGAGDFYLWRSGPNGFAPLHYPEEKVDAVIFTAVDRKGDLWITTNSGRAWHLSNGSWNDETATLGKKPGIKGAMTDDAAGNVWFAFSNKVVKWDGSTFSRFSFPDGQRGVSENTMSVRGEHVWLAGAGGVQLFMMGGFHLMKWRDPGMPGRLSGIVETRTGDLWMNGFSGIAHLSATEVNRWLQHPDAPVSGERLDELDGLPGFSEEPLPEPSVVEAPDGRLWFATTRGIAWLDPAALERDRNQVPPPVFISSVIANAKTFVGADGLTLPAHTENLEFDYTALSLAIPERVQFRYKLDGIDEGWQNAGTRRQAFYTKLRPAHYTFHVTACNNDGVWNEAGAALDFSVAPAYYQTVWFRVSVAAAILALLAALYRLRLRQMSRQFSIRMEERVNERTRIARDLHDTLLQGFQGVLLKFSAVSYMLPDDSRARAVLEQAIEQARQSIAEGRDAVQGLRASTLATHDLARTLSTIGMELASECGNGNRPGFRVEVEGTSMDLAPLVRDEVYRIVVEALRNAFRHAHAGQIEVEIHYEKRRLRVQVRDDGKGIDQSILDAGERRGHHGLKGMHERAGLIMGRLAVWSKPDSGCEVELTVPGSVAYAGPVAENQRVS